ncbi:sodium/bile acid cotransporter 7 [Nasonia vitripennis]|uniref:Sodium/bile acid cotransporter 7 n=1 Tax=Nasonia vitripennis TaxID=7425 RepID=A0A7M7H4S7_NASVI|nr:sodium/bile acid cotransporter 7 [Nasonia vitripennis]XP_031776831.1 sodium/bile acid cotransporter 7 [Nasonia vitripennis]
MEVDVECNKPLIVTVSQKKKVKRKAILYRFSFFACMNICMILAFFTSNLGGSKGLINGNFVIWYFAVPLIYFEAGLCCNYRALFSVFRDGYLLSFLMIFIYVLIPIVARIGSYLLGSAGVNSRLLKGIEVLHCLPPPFSTSLVLSRIANADIPTSVVTILICHFGGMLLSPILLYIMLGATVPPLTEINLREITYSTLIPLAIGVSLRSICFKEQQSVASLSQVDRTKWISQVLLLLTAYNLFCDAFTIDAAALYAIDILLCVFIACLSQVLMTCICWTLCSTWLSQDVLLATVFTCTYKSIGFGGWLMRTAFRNTVQTAAVNLPLGILTVAQLLLGSLLASWLAP